MRRRIMSKMKFEGGAKMTFPAVKKKASCVGTPVYISGFVFLIGIYTDHFFCVFLIHYK